MTQTRSNVLSQPSIFIILFSLHQDSLQDNSPTVAQGLLHRCSTRAGRLLNGGCQYDSFVGLVRPSRSKLCHLDSALWALCKVNFVLYCLYSSIRWISNGMNATPNRGRMWILAICSLQSRLGQSSTPIGCPWFREHGLAMLINSSSSATSQVHLARWINPRNYSHLKRNVLITDERIPTVSLGVPNAESGHCLKTMAIIDHLGEWIAASVEPSPGWYVIADDDSIIG